MSITITCEFSSGHQAGTAADRLRRRGYIVSTAEKKNPIPDPLLVAYPYGTAGGNTAGNSLMAALPPMAGNSLRLHTPEPQKTALLSVLTDDTEATECRQLLTALGGRLL